MGLSDDLRAFWKLADTSDSGPNGFGLTNNNTVTFVSGKIGDAARFAAASSQYLSRADHASLSFGNADFTLSVWVKLASTGTTRPIINKATAEWRLGITSANKIIFQFPGGGSLTHSLALSASTWYHVVAWYDAAADLMWVSVNDGTPESAADSAGPVDSTNDVRIGRLGTAYWDGDLDAIGVWGRVVTPAERTALYNAGAGLEPPFATIYSQTLSESASLSEAVTKSLSRGLADGAALSDLVAPRALARTLAEGVLLADASVMALARVFEEAMALSDTRGALLSRGLADVAGLGDELVRTVARTLGDGVTLAEQRLALLVRAFEENLQLEDVVVRTLSRTFLEALAMSDSFVALVPKLMAYRVGVGPTSTRLGSSVTSARLLKGGGGGS